MARNCNVYGEGDDWTWWTWCWWWPDFSYDLIFRSLASMWVQTPRPAGRAPPADLGTERPNQTGPPRLRSTERELRHAETQTGIHQQRGLTLLPSRKLRGLAHPAGSTWAPRPLSNSWAAFICATCDEATDALNDSMDLQHRLDLSMFCMDGQPNEWDICSKEKGISIN